MTIAAKHKILLVDDDIELLRLLSIRLTGAGYDITAVDSAQKAVPPRALRARRADPHPVRGQHVVHGLASLPRALKLPWYI